MKLLKYNDITVGHDDDFLYDHLLTTLSHVKLILGGNGLDSTLRKHPRLLNYAKAKASKKLDSIEEFFLDDGSLNPDAISSFRNKSNINVN